MIIEGITWIVNLDLLYVHVGGGGDTGAEEMQIWKEKVKSG